MRRLIERVMGRLAWVRTRQDTYDDLIARHRRVLESKDSVIESLREKVAMQEEQIRFLAAGTELQRAWIDKQIATFSREEQGIPR